MIDFADSNLEKLSLDEKKKFLSFSLKFLNYSYDDLKFEDLSENDLLFDKLKNQIKTENGLFSAKIHLINQLINFEYGVIYPDLLDYFCSVLSYHIKVDWGMVGWNLYSFNNVIENYNECPIVLDFRDSEWSNIFLETAKLIVKLIECVIKYYNRFEKNSESDEPSWYSHYYKKVKLPNFCWLEAIQLAIPGIIETENPIYFNVLNVLLTHSKQLKHIGLNHIYISWIVPLMKLVEGTNNENRIKDLLKETDVNRTSLSLFCCPANGIKMLQPAYVSIDETGFYEKVKNFHISKNKQNILLEKKEVIKDKKSRKDLSKSIRKLAKSDSNILEVEKSRHIQKIEQRHKRFDKILTEDQEEYKKSKTYGGTMDTSLNPYRKNKRSKVRKGEHNSIHKK